MSTTPRSNAAATDDANNNTHAAIIALAPLLEHENAQLREALEELHNADLAFVELYNRMDSDDEEKLPTCADVKAAKHRCGLARDMARATLARVRS